MRKKKSDIPNKFTGAYYNKDYFQTPKGKKFMRPNGTIDAWSYASPDGESEVFKYILDAWNKMFQPKTMLDIGCGRGTVVAYARDIEIEAFGFDFSEWAVSDEGRYQRCKKEWLKQHDATKTWPYPDNSFDLTVALDLFEHIYHDDIPFVVSELFRVSKKWIFLQIATVNVVDHLGSLGRKAELGYMLKKGEPISIEREGNAVAGHVTVTDRSTWEEWIDHDDWILKRVLVNLFTNYMGNFMNKNWLLNTMLIYEKME